MDTGGSTPVAAHGSTSRPLRQPTTVLVDVLACGPANRGDDGVGAAVLSGLRDRLPGDVRLRAVGRLAVDDLLKVHAGARLIVVDAATGLRGGRVAQMPIAGLLQRTDGVRPRTAQALALPEVLGVVAMIRGRPLEGTIFLVGGVQFQAGAGLSPSVRRAVPAISAAIEQACASVRGQT